MTFAHTRKSLYCAGAKVIVGVVFVMVAGTVIGEVFLPVPAMTISAAEVALSIPNDDGSGLAFRPEFLKHVSALKTAPGDGGREVKSPTALSFRTKPSGACRSFQLVYSSRDRNNPSAPGWLRIRPAGPPGCTARIDVSPLQEPMFPEIPIDHEIDLLLPGSAAEDAKVVDQRAKLGKESMVVDQRAERLEATTAFKARGGPLSLYAADVQAETTVEIAGSKLAIQSLFVSTKNAADGALVATLTSTVPPVVIVDKHDVGLLYRLKTIQTLYDCCFSKIVGGLK